MYMWWLPETCAVAQVRTVCIHLDIPKQKRPYITRPWGSTTLKNGVLVPHETSLSRYFRGTWMSTVMAQ